MISHRHKLNKVGSKYPASLNVFHLGAGLTTYIGMFKLTTIFYFAFQCLVRAPTLDVDDGTALFWTPLSMALYSLPMISTQLITSPVTNSINVLLPQEARKNDKTLQQWAENPPKDTLIDFTTLRFLPFPKRKTVKLEDLRMLPPGKWYRIAQFEYMPPKLRASNEGKPLGLLKGFLGGRRTFYVREGSSFTRTTRGPTVWPALVDVILAQSGVKVLEDDRPRTKVGPRPAAKRTPPGQSR
ncbi:Hypothetical protein D9617_20g027550 [Elsinoe fawcettii]|nr:Hypothetical protein D9617_20g027550 [Elsinoe fawcettii]